MDKHQTQQKNKNPKVELQIRFWWQANSENWDFPSKNGCSSHFSVDSLGTLKVFPRFLAFSVGQ
jgi:hypothetical protein